MEIPMFDALEGIFPRHYPYNVYGGSAWLVYLATDISAMGDSVP